jgi:hypothetical protein
VGPDARRSVCSGCSVGCNVTLDSRDGALLRVLARENRGDRRRLAVRPRPLRDAAAGDGAAHAGADGSQARAAPLLRRDGRLQRVPLDGAVQRAAELLRDAARAVLAVASLSNEASRSRPTARALPGRPVGFARAVASPWPVAGRIAQPRRVHERRRRRLDPWTELPMPGAVAAQGRRRGGTLVASARQRPVPRQPRTGCRAAPARAAGATLDLVRRAGRHAASRAAPPRPRTCAPPGRRQCCSAAARREPRLGARASARRLPEVDAATGFMRRAGCRAPTRAAPPNVQAALVQSTRSARGRGARTFGGDAPVLPHGGRAIVARRRRARDARSRSCCRSRTRTRPTATTPNLEGRGSRCAAAATPAPSVRWTTRCWALLAALAAVPAEAKR